MAIFAFFFVICTKLADDEKSGDEALSFDDSSEEEDLEDEPDHYENDGFVVEDVDDEEASEQRRRRRRRERERERGTEELDLVLEDEVGEGGEAEGRGEGGGDHEGGDEERRKKRKRRPTREELDEDDLMLIAENTGESLPAKSSSDKFKRLKKNRDELGLGMDFDDRHGSAEGERLDEATLEKDLFGDGTASPTFQPPLLLLPPLPPLGWRLSLLGPRALPARFLALCSRRSDRPRNVFTACAQRR